MVYVWVIRVKKTNRKRLQTMSKIEEMIEEIEVFNGLRADQIVPMSEAFAASGVSEVMTSFEMGDSKEDKLKFHQIKDQPSKRLADMMNKEITMVGFIAHWVETKNGQTGEPEMAPRIIILGDDGETYSCVSIGIYNSLRNIVADLWLPTEADPIKVTPRRVQGKNKYEFTTIEVTGI